MRSNLLIPGSSYKFWKDVALLTQNLSLTGHPANLISVQHFFLLTVLHVQWIINAAYLQTRISWILTLPAGIVGAKNRELPKDFNVV